MNLPNKLTLSRFVLTVAFLLVIFSKVKFHQTIGLVLFVAAGISDFLDGQVARRRNLITNFGILMDPLADKIMVCSAFIAFVELRRIEAWMVVIIVARELAITGLRLVAASKNVVLAAEGYGKHKDEIKTELAKAITKTVVDQKRSEIKIKKAEGKEATGAQKSATEAMKDKVTLWPMPQFPHNYNSVTRHEIYRWFNTHFGLNLGGDRLTEHDYPLLTKEQLTVWDDKHPAPEGERKAPAAF